MEGFALGWMCLPLAILQIIFTKEAFPSFTKQRQHCVFSTSLQVWKASFISWSWTQSSLWRDRGLRDKLWVSERKLSALLCLRRSCLSCWSRKNSSPAHDSKWYVAWQKISNHYDNPFIIWSVFFKERMPKYRLLRPAMWIFAGFFSLLWLWFYD